MKEVSIVEYGGMGSYVGGWGAIRIRCGMYDESPKNGGRDRMSSSGCRMAGKGGDPVCKEDTES